MLQIIFLRTLQINTTKFHLVVFSLFIILQLIKANNFLKIIPDEEFYKMQCLEFY